MLKLWENPPILSPEVQSLAELCGQWWVGHTRPRCEKAFAWDLLRSGIRYFLPMIERVRVSGGRKRRVLLPLFASYVFFRGDEADRAGAVRTNRLCGIIEVPDQQKLTCELVAIEKALLGKAQLDPYPFAAVGQRCRIRSGVFKGLEGVVIRRDKVACLVLEISMFGQGAAMEIGADLLEPTE